MPNVIIDDINLSNIANAIREKNGSTDTYKIKDMAQAILDIVSGGGVGACYPIRVIAETPTVRIEQGE